MKNFWEKTISILPYFILIIISGSILILFYKYNLNFGEYLQILQTLIWPAIVLVSILFFKKVFTYLFFSMEEFGFFGSKGRLKNVEEVIKEKVEERIKEEKDQEKTVIQMKKFEQELSSANKSKDDANKEAEENRELANKIFREYKDVSSANVELSKELNELRKEKQDRINRFNAFSRKTKQYRVENEDMIDKSSSTLKADKEKVPTSSDAPVGAEKEKVKKKAEK